jgi:hypothetical protein
MKGRRTAAMLCVLLVHALFAWAFLVSSAPDPFEPLAVLESFTPMELVLIDPDEEEPETSPAIASPEIPVRPPPPAAPVAREATPDPPAAITAQPWVDWPRETRESAARVLAREREAERLAKMFAGPDGTWASLTKRQRSKLNKFRWAPGVDGLERDENGNTIYRLPSGCTIVNFMFFGCPIGKQPVNDDMFENMRLYFDEQRLPQTNEGNGTEPESKRPPKWSGPLPD